MPLGGSHDPPVSLPALKEALLKGLPSLSWKHVEREGNWIWESKGLDFMSVLSAISNVTLGKSLSSEPQRSHAKTDLLGDALVQSLALCQVLRVLGGSPPPCHLL